MKKISIRSTHTLVLAFCLAAATACGAAVGPDGEPEGGADVFGQSAGDETAADAADLVDLEQAEATNPEIGSTSQPLFGSDACKNTEIIVTNSRDRNGVSTDIRVFKVKYYSASEGKWYTENLANRDVDYGDTEWWWNQDLAHAENDLLTQWRAYYKYREADGDWSDLVYQTINTPDVNCHADDNFNLTVQ